MTAAMCAGTRLGSMPGTSIPADATPRPDNRPTTRSPTTDVTERNLVVGEESDTAASNHLDQEVKLRQFNSSCCPDDTGITTDRGVDIAVGITAQRRMSKGERRHHLLDVAARLLEAGDTQAVTMERVAEHAGVSKALPYAHFDNAEDLLVTLYRRSSMELGESIWQALVSADRSDDRAQVWADAYYHCSVTQGVVFAALIRPGSSIPAKADRRGHADEFVRRILHRFFGVDQAHAGAVSSVIQGAFHGGSHTWLRDEASRPVVVAAAADVVRSIVATAPKCDRHDHDRETR